MEGARSPAEAFRADICEGGSDAERDAYDAIAVGIRIGATRIACSVSSLARCQGEMFGSTANIGVRPCRVGAMTRGSDGRSVARQRDISRSTRISSQTGMTMAAPSTKIPATSSSVSKLKLER